VPQIRARQACHILPADDTHLFNVARAATARVERLINKASMISAVCACVGMVLDGMAVMATTGARALIED